MSAINPDVVEDFINNGHFNIDNFGPLHAPLLDLKIERDKKLELILTTTSDTDAKSDSEDHPPGTVRVNDSLIEMTSISGSKVKISGIQPYNYTISTDANGKTTRTELSTASKVSAEIRDVKSGRYLIEWLENVDDGSFFWSDRTKSESENTNLTIIGSGSDAIEIKEKSTSIRGARNCISFNIDNNKFYLVSSGEDTKNVGVKSGYILYAGIPSCEFRRKIRDCLSFIIGRPLIQIGHSVFNSVWESVSFESISPYSMGQAYFDIYSMPPVSLGNKFQGKIDEEPLSTLLLSIYQNYDQYNFGYLSWAYWHAICAPVHIAAVHFGACIESLQKSYINNNGKLFRTSLLDKPLWKPLRNGVLEILSSIEIEDTEKKVLENKINSLNQTPQSILTERFLNSLDIKLSELERSAWKQRNNAAHGNEAEEGGEIKLIREIKVIKVIFHRVFLKIVNGSEYYIDYYSIGFPIRRITDSIENNA